MMDKEKLVSRIEALRGDEQAIVESLLDRLARGRKDYGPWHVNDGRDYSIEMFEEIIDALHYCAASIVKIRKGVL